MDNLRRIENIERDLRGWIREGDVKLPDSVYDWIDRRGSIPKIFRVLYPTLHWCCEWDYMLVYDKMEEYNCCQCLRTGNRI